MSDEMKPDLPATTEDETNSTLGVVTDLILDSTIPVSIRRNMFKVADRLCSALIKVPVEALERRTAEKRAESEARIKIGQEVTDQIIQQIKVDPEFPQRAGTSFAKKILREQFNCEKILSIAANQLKKVKYNSSTDQNIESEVEKLIDDDWFNAFEKEANQKSDKDMQHRFGRVLAGEVANPGSYSIRAVKTLGELDLKAARLFETLCSLCIVLGDPMQGQVIDARVSSLGGDANANTLRGYGLAFCDLNILNEYGLITSEYHSSHGYYEVVQNENTQRCFPFWYQGNYWGLCPLPGWRKEDRFNLRLSGVALSQVSRELLRVVDLDPADEPLKTARQEYTTDLKKYFEDQRLRMAEAQLKLEYFDGHPIPSAHYYVR